MFFAQQCNHGILRRLFRPYAGYLHTIPRLVTAATALVPILWVPTAFSCVSALTASLAVSCFYWPRFRFVMPDPLRAACCIVAATAIPISDELLGTLCSLQRSLAIFGLLLIVLPIDQIVVKRRELALLVLQVLFALSSPDVLVLLPILGWQAVRRRGFFLIRPWAAIAVLAVQCFLAVTANTDIGNPHLNADSLLSSTLARGLNCSRGGTRFSQPMSPLLRSYLSLVGEIFMISF